MLIAEELAVASLDPTKGRPINSNEAAMPACLSGALVAELGLADQVLLDGKRFVVTGEPPAAGLLREVWEVIAEGGGRRATDQLQRIDKDLGRVRRRVIDGLIDAGVLGRTTGGLLHVTAHPLRRPELREALVNRLRTAASGEGPLEPRTAVLLALAGPARLLEVVADKPRGHAKRRMAEAAEAIPVVAVVKKVIAASQVAVVAVS